MAHAGAPADDHLPQLPLVASDTTMRALIAARLHRGWSLRGLRIRDVGYYPGQTCMLTYDLRLESPDGGRHTHTLYARAFGPEPVPATFLDQPPLVGAMPSWWPDLRLALWHFPLDPGLPGLASIWPTNPSDADPEADAPGTRAEILNYVPTKRCIFLGADGTALGKAYASDALRLFLQMQRL